MEQGTANSAMSKLELIRIALDTSPDGWKDHLESIRSMMASLDFSDASQGESQREWQLSVLTVFQRVVHVGIDNEGSDVQDIMEWCLKQSLVLIHFYPEDVTLLALIGENWLLRAQKPLLNIHQEEQSSVSSGDSQYPMSTSVEAQSQTESAKFEAERRLDAADYVEARALLLPAVEYLKRAVAAARIQNKITGVLLTKAAEAYMSLGNVSSIKVNEPYFRAALLYLQEASRVPDYNLPAHLQHYLEDFGPVALG
ncbi:unnamed protein product [Periconia digitata]|uniref:Uncharacterized protein n=1 Tax=Periconia digitata TaxID=1303443 RepID=A0A9W4UA26_9PLEO|nr:unnamed protein product [Periconia digitata]